MRDDKSGDTLGLAALIFVPVLLFGGLAYIGLLVLWVLFASLSFFALCCILMGAGEGFLKRAAIGGVLAAIAGAFVFGNDVVSVNVLNNATLSHAARFIIVLDAFALPFIIYALPHFMGADGEAVPIQQPPAPAGGSRNGGTYAHDPAFDYDPSRFASGNEGTAGNTQRQAYTAASAATDLVAVGEDENATDARLWAVAEDPRTSEEERQAAMRALRKRGGRRP